MNDKKQKVYKKFIPNQNWTNSEKSFYQRINKNISFCIIEIKKAKTKEAKALYTTTLGFQKKALRSLLERIRRRFETEKKT